MLKNLLFVVLGGGFGSGLRYLVATYVSRFYGGLFPMGTFLVNVTGSFVIGVLMTFFVDRNHLSSPWRLFLVTGILGGYTTFSSFEWETFATLKGGAPLISALNVVSSVALGFLGVWLGSFLTQKSSMQ